MQVIISILFSLTLLFSSSFVLAAKPVKSKDDGTTIHQKGFGKGKAAKAEAVAAAEAEAIAQAEAEAIAQAEAEAIAQAEAEAVAQAEAEAIAQAEAEAIAQAEAEVIARAEAEAIAQAEAEAIAQAEAGLVSVNLTWVIPTTRTNGDALLATDLVGYEIYYTTDSDASAAYSIENGNANTYTLDGLVPDTYHFAIISIDTEGLKSELSEVVSLVVSR
jgi:hypothetical protein